MTHTKINKLKTCIDGKRRNHRWRSSGKKQMASFKEQQAWGKEEACISKKLEAKSSSFSNYVTLCGKSISSFVLQTTISMTQKDVEQNDLNYSLLMSHQRGSPPKQLTGNYMTHDLGT